MNSLMYRLRTRQALLVGLLLCLAALTAGCGRLPSPLGWLRGERVNAADSATAALSPLDDPTSKLTLRLNPPAGSGGLYIEVRGEQWPRNMMTLVALEDDQGRSDTLAAVDTDQSGNLATGFVFPIDSRWIESDSTWVVVTTADGKVEAKTRFTVVPPGQEAPADAPTETIVNTGGNAGDVASSNAVTATERISHEVSLPLVVHSEAERRSLAARGEPQAVEIVFQPGRAKAIRCNDPASWITVAILSTDAFDASDVDAGSVSVANGPRSASLVRPLDQGTVVLVGTASGEQADRIAANLANYTWRWHMEDVNKDGLADMVMEFRLDSTDLTCDAVDVLVTGSTRDGGSFEGRDQVESRAEPVRDEDKQKNADQKNTDQRNADQKPDNKKQDNQKQDDKKQDDKKKNNRDDDDDDDDDRRRRNDRRNRRGRG